MNYQLNILPSGEIHICPPNYSLPIGVCVLGGQGIFVGQLSFLRIQQEPFQNNFISIA